MTLPRLTVVLLALATTSCTTIVANLAAGALSGDSNTFRADDDPELIREAIPFGLKLTESFLETSPENPQLLLSASSGFTQYAYGFVVPDADELDAADPAKARLGYARAKKLLRRANEYGFRGLEVRWGKGFRAAFEKDRAGTLKRLTSKDDVPFLYWTSASLATLVSLSKDDMKAVGRLPQVEALMARALELDESFGDGALHEFYAAYDCSRAEATGGGVKRAKVHYERALALTHGKKLAPLVSWADQAVQEQDHKLFDQLLDQALAFDVDEEPRFRLVNLIAQRRARYLKARASDLFLE